MCRGDVGDIDSHQLDTLSLSPAARKTEGRRGERGPDKGLVRERAGAEGEKEPELFSFSKRERERENGGTAASEKAEM